MAKSNIIVSDEVVWCYKHVNAIPIGEEISKLSDYEKYLFCLLSIDFYTEDNDFFIENMKSLETFINNISLVMENNDYTDIDEDLKKLQTELDDKYLNLGDIHLKDGSKLPDPTTELEAKAIRRNFTIDRLFE